MMRSSDLENNLEIFVCLWIEEICIGWKASEVMRFTLEYIEEELIMPLT